MRTVSKSLSILTMCLSLQAHSAKTQQADLGSVEGMWTLFSEKCGLFIDDPNGFVQSPSHFTIRDWKWIIRAASSVGFIEYFSLSPNRSHVFTAIGNATSQGVSLECSLDGKLTGPTTATDAFNAIKSYFSTRSDLTYLSEEVAFFGDPSNVAELKEYYSTSHVIRIEGGFANTELVASIRADDGGAVYFEVGDLR